MDYKEKYEIALKGIREILSSGEDSIKMSRLQLRLQGVFPELKESEDERIKNLIYCLIRDRSDNRNLLEHNGVTVEQALSWLEKQGEQKPAFDIDIPFGAKDSELIEASYYIPEGFHAEIEGNHVVIKKGEQKSAWSEEDETNLRRTEYAVMKFFGGDCSLVDWLRKSLKERYTWKPSDEQMEALEHFVRSIGESGYASPYDNNTKLLYSLLSDLKKLKE